MLTWMAWPVLGQVSYFCPTPSMTTRPSIFAWIGVGRKWWMVPGTPTGKG